MKIQSKVFSNLYQDSVSLMQISARISKLPGIHNASVVMGTPMNLDQLREAGLGTELRAGPNDLIIAVMPCFVEAISTLAQIVAKGEPQ